MKRSEGNSLSSEL